MIRSRALRDFAAAVLAGALLLVAGMAQAQTVTNTASARWSENGGDRTAASNTVSFAVLRPAAIVETLSAGTLPGEVVQVMPSQCGGQALPPAAAGAGGATVSLANSIRPGQTLIVRITAPASNRDPRTLDTVVVQLMTNRGERETITILETAPDSGVFIGSLPTVGLPPAAVAGDCRLSVAGGDEISLDVRDGRSLNAIAASRVPVVAEPYGLVFDSEDGTLIDGAAVTLVDAATGAPAAVFAEDGVTPWPATVISGRPVTDGAGNTHLLLPGEYRFPVVPAGQYRVVVTPPAPYTAPSAATPGQLAQLPRPDGGAFTIGAGSYGGGVAFAPGARARFDIPLDRPGIAVAIGKTASRASAAPGDVVLYTIRVTNNDPLGAKRQVVLTDVPSRWLRLRPGSIRIDGVAPADSTVTVAADGRTVTIRLGDLPAAATRTVAYAMTVRSDAPPSHAANRAEAVDARGGRAVANAVVAITREPLAGRMTIIGRVVEGDCRTAGVGRGVPGVRVMLEDGSFVLTDAEGRYHFEGVVPGTHVVQAASETLPQGGAFIDCVRSTRSAGKAESRFVTGQGGSLVQVDFVAAFAEPRPATATVAPPLETTVPADVASDRAAAGAETDWLAVGDGPTAFLFPVAEHNPRAPAIRVAIRHRAGETVALTAGGKPVEGVAFDGVKASPQGFAVSVWRGVPLSGETTRLLATVHGADGAVSATLAREVRFSATPARVELVPQASRLVADGASRPVVAVRVLDRLGRPVHAGLTGGFEINAPYESAAEGDALQSRQLTRLDRGSPTWVVTGDDGIALIELAPTMVSGPLRLDFAFADERITRRQMLEAWIVPGAQQWTLVGLAEGSAGARSVADAMETNGRFDSDLGDNARVAFYAKGRVLGRFLLTAAYDSARQRDDQPLLGTIDPDAYYTVFADGAERRFDAASRSKLYVRLEARAFYALYGDFVTGFDQTRLARYQRAMTGFKAEGRFGAAHVQGFAAQTDDLLRRDEIQGNGLSGPYRLSSRAPIPNSEIVTLETRDRFRSELIVSRRVLTRFIDYELDLLAGTIRFKEPILSRDADLNPQFIVVEYQVDRADRGKINAGVRADVAGAGGQVRLGATVISDTGSATGGRTDLLALDARARLSPDTELRAEAAVSAGPGPSAGSAPKAWLIEAEHHDERLDLLAYVRSTADGFGGGQINAAERGRRKVGVDARYRFDDAFSLTASAWSDDSLTDASRRRAVEVNGLFRTPDTDIRLGIAHFADRLEGGDATSTVLQGSVTRRLLDNRLEVSGTASVALGEAESIDLPSRYRLDARYAVTSAVRLTGTYEIATGEAVEARTARAGFEVSPWQGSRVVGALGRQDLGRQDIAENGRRSFAAFGLSQSVQVGDFTFDATLDSARTLDRFDAGRLVNPDHPASSGGLLGDTGTLTEDFTAVTLGGTWRRALWTATARAEVREGALADRQGVTLGAIRQLGEGSAVGTGVVWTRAQGLAGTGSEVIDAAISAAHRPADSAFRFLTKLQYRSDKVTAAVAGEAGPAGRAALTVDGDAASRRVIASVSANWSPWTVEGDERLQRHEIGVFGAVRHSFDRLEGLDLSATSVLGGLDARIALGDRFEIGAAATGRYGVTDGVADVAFGPQVGVTPVRDVLLTVGYNITGFRDPDFADDRNTREGVFVAVKLKFDADAFAMLGLGR